VTHCLTGDDVCRTRLIVSLARISLSVSCENLHCDVTRRARQAPDSRLSNGATNQNARLAGAHSTDRRPQRRRLRQKLRQRHQPTETAHRKKEISMKVTHYRYTIQHRKYKKRSSLDSKSNRFSTSRPHFSLEPHLQNHSFMHIMERYKKPFRGGFESSHVEGFSVPKKRKKNVRQCSRQLNLGLLIEFHSF